MLYNLNIYHFYLKVKYREELRILEIIRPRNLSLKIIWSLSEIRIFFSPDRTVWD